MNKCNCGREIRYSTLFSNDGVFDTSKGSCNKYSVCLPYDEVLTQRDNYRKLLKELQEAMGDVLTFREGTSHYNEAVVVYQRISKEMENKV